jgi:hypothetical protein
MTVQNQENVSGYFNKIQSTGFTADVRAYAYVQTTREVINQLNGSKQQQIVNYLYYLDILARDGQTINAILPGLVKEPAPNPVTLYSYYPDNSQALAIVEETDGFDSNTAKDPEQKAREETGILLWMAAKRQVGIRKIFSTQLRKSAACQGVVIPTAAMPGLFEADNLKKPKSDKSRPEDTQWFVLLMLDDIPEMQQWPISALYHARLDKHVSLPLLPEWHDWTWQFAADSGLIMPMQTKGCKAYLCQVPNEAWLHLALKDAIKNRRIYTGPDLDLESRESMAAEGSTAASVPIKQLPLLAASEPKATDNIGKLSLGGPALPTIAVESQALITDNSSNFAQSTEISSSVDSDENFPLAKAS